MQEATLVQWRIQPGDRIVRGQVIGEVDTAKGVIDLECFQEGFVEKLVAAEGQTIPVGAVMLVIKNSLGEVASSAKDVGVQSPVQETLPQQQGPAQELFSPIAGATSSATSASRPKVSPLARRRASEIGIDLSRVSGTGAEGAITVEDVDRAAANQPVAKKEKDPAASRRALRSAIAAAMSRSKQEIPHFYLQTLIDMSQALSWLERENSQRAIAARLLPAVVLLKAVARAIAEVPQLNGYWTDGEVHLSDRVHAGFAVAMTGGGLVAPAIHDVGAKSLDQLMADLHDLIPRARTGRLRSSEMTDATITVTSLGDLGVDSVAGIIYPPQVALVGFGKILSRPWVDSGELCVRPVVVASLSADHRATDGIIGARYLDSLGRILQEPQSL